jgi:hypothetical protein
MSRAREFADLAGSADAGGLTGRNLIINGAMQVWQRGIDFNSAGSGNYTADRWAVIASGLDGNANIDRSTDVPSGQGFGYSWKLSMSASEASLDAADHVGIRMLLEGQDLQQIEKGTSNAKKMTVSFWCKSSVASPNYTLDIKDFDNTRVYDVAFSIDAANTWEYKTLTIDGDTTGTLDNDNAKSLQFLWFFDAGSTYTGGTFSEHTWATQTNNTRVKGTTGWLESSNPEFYITGVQLEVGEKATPFEHRSYGDELHRCMRYYNISGMICATGTPDRYFTQIHLPVEMRASPSLSTLAIDSGSGAQVAPNWDRENNTTSRKSFYQGNPNSVTSSARFSFDAEL